MEKTEKKKLSLTARILIGLAAGFVVGIVLNLLPASFVRDTVLVDGILYFVGQAFMRLLKMLVVPLVFFSIANGAAAIGDPKKLGRVGGKTILLFTFTTAIAACIGLIAAYIMKPGAGLDMSAVVQGEVSTTASTSLVETMLNIIPTNVFNALSSGTMLQIICFALILGVIIARIGDKVAGVARAISQLNEIMLDMTFLIMKVAPCGVFCLIATTFASMGFPALLPLIKYILCIAICLVVHIVVVYGSMYKIFTGLKARDFFKKIWPVMCFQFSTCSSNSTIPYNIACSEEKFGVSDRIAGFVIPLGATINMDGTAIMQAVAALFAAQLYGINFGAGQIISIVLAAVLASIGTAGVPGAGLIMMSMVFTTVGLPLEAIALVMGIDRIVDMMRGVANVTGDAMCAVIVAKQEGELDMDIYNGVKQFELDAEI